MRPLGSEGLDGGEWALLDLGIRCVVAPSFADIFYNNCFKNGILPVALPEEHVEALMADGDAGRSVEVDLEAQVVRREGEAPIAFEVEPFRRHCLLEGLDDVGLTLQKEAAIDAFEKRMAEQTPWL